MALFNIPKRKEISITDIVKQAQEANGHHH